jgi:TfoX/Sxy family transcriptional regulator of competence genes
MAESKMKWRKSPPELIAAFVAAFPGPPAERRQMFGYPAGFVNGNMFTGLHQEDWMVRLSEDDRAKLLKLPGAKPFEPMPGHAMREYIVMPPAVVADAKALKTWLGKAMAYTASKPPKAGKTKTPKKVAAKKKA